VIKLNVYIKLFCMVTVQRGRCKKRLCHWKIVYYNLDA